MMTVAKMIAPKNVIIAEFRPVAARPGIRRGVGLRRRLRPVSPPAAVHHDGRDEASECRRLSALSLLDLTDDQNYDTERQRSGGRV